MLTSVKENKSQNYKVSFCEKTERKKQYILSKRVYQMIYYFVNKASYLFSLENKVSVEPNTGEKNCMLQSELEKD